MLNFFSVGIISTDVALPSELIEHLGEMDEGQPTVFGLGTAQDGTTAWEALQWLLADDVVEGEAKSLCNVSTSLCSGSHLHHWTAKSQA